MDNLQGFLYIYTYHLLGWFRRRILLILLCGFWGLPPKHMNRGYVAQIEGYGFWGDLIALNLERLNALTRFPHLMAFPEFRA